VYDLYAVTCSRNVDLQDDAEVLIVVIVVGVWEMGAGHTKWLRLEDGKDCGVEVGQCRRTECVIVHLILL